MPVKLLKSIAVFGRELLANPGATGALCPSSPRLGRRMASFIPKDHKGLVVELGAGTGSVTHELLARGIPPKKLISIELSEKLAFHLRGRFPDLKVIQGNAAELQNLIKASAKEANGQVDFVVSSLPFRSLPDDLCQKIAQQIEQTLGGTGRFIQFTYDLRSKNFIHFQRFTHLRAAIVWANIPPARVDLFQANGRR